MGAKKKTERKWSKRVKAEKKVSKKKNKETAHGTIRESMARKEKSFSWRSAEQTAKIAAYMTANAPCIEITIEGMRPDGAPDYWSVIVPEGTSQKKLEKIIDKGTEAVGVFNVAVPCPPYCPHDPDSGA